MNHRTLYVHRAPVLRMPRPLPMVLPSAVVGLVWIFVLLPGLVAADDQCGLPPGVEEVPHGTPPGGTPGGSDGPPLADTGACCLVSGVCQIKSAGGCEAVHGVYHPGVECLPSPCDSSVLPPNLGGVLVFHAPPGLTYTASSNYIGSSSAVACEDFVPTIDEVSETPVVYYLMAAFDPLAEPRLKGVSFGVGYDGPEISLVDYGGCGDFELPSTQWPSPGSGNAVTWAEPQIGPVTEVAWFAAYNYYGTPQVLRVTDHPVQGLAMADDATPSRSTPVYATGTLGFNVPGTPACAKIPEEACLKWLHVNIHFMLEDDGTGNFTETDDGRGDVAFSGFDWAEDFIWALNDRVENGMCSPRLPCGNSMPVPVADWRFLLKGVYFHRDSELYDFLNTSARLKEMTDRYGQETDTEINLFLPVSPSNETTSGRGSTIGPAARYSISFRNPWRDYHDVGAQAWSYCPIFLHELGHLMNLYHTYGGDYCSDTPNNPNCWNVTASGACSDPCNVSNNLMDYNADQCALSPCQMDRVRDALTGYLYDYWTCSPCRPAEANAALPRLVGDNVPVVLDGRASIFEDSYFVEVYEVSGWDEDIVVGPHWSQWFDGQAGRIDLTEYYDFQADRIYRVRLAVQNTCQVWDEEVRYVRIHPACFTTCLPKVLWLSDRQGTPQVMARVANGDGEVVAVTDEPNEVRHPSWSPDGARILYLTQRDGDDRMVITNTCGAVIKEFSAADLLLTDSFYYPAWNHDGSRIIFSYGTWPSLGIAYLEFPAPYAFDSATLTVLVPESSNMAAIDPEFSADGTKVYFHGAFDSSVYGDVSNLFELDLGGGGPQVLSSQNGIIERAFHPSVAPVGDALVFNSELYKDDPSIEGEALIHLDLGSDTETALTNQPGNEGGSYATAGTGELMTWSTQPVGFFRWFGGTPTHFDVRDPKNRFVDGAPRWFAKACSPVVWGSWSAVYSAWAANANGGYAGSSEMFALSGIYFGGSSSASSTPHHWEVDEYGSWHSVTVTPAPPLRERPAVAWDSLRETLVVFGGEGAMGDLGDLWEYDGAWTLRWDGSSGPSPSPRAGARMIFDPVAQRCLLVGGNVADNGMWAWDGTEWAQVSASALPPVRSDHMWAYDSGQQRGVLFGGRNLDGTFRSDTWIWQGGVWTEVPIAGPTARADAAGTYSSTSGSIYLTGGAGAGANALGDVWEFAAGSSWSLVDATMPPRAGHVSLIDETLGRLTVIDGVDSTGAATQTQLMYSLFEPSTGVPAAPVELGPTAVVAGPNPLSSKFRIRFQLAAPQPVDIAIFDVAGRRVRSLVEETLGAGEHLVEWDTRDRRGENAPAGVYFYLVQTPDRAVSNKVVLVR